MEDQALQAAFEIKTACDEISRRLLRWHWEQKPGAHTLDALLRQIQRRQKESPEYYDRMPDLAGKTSWQQLDTTLCMRVLLDPEKDAARPLDLLGNTARPGAARHACNAVRTARNQAAHAADATDAAHAAILFNEAVEALEEGYAGSAFREAELAQYYREAEGFLELCGADRTPSAARQSAASKKTGAGPAASRSKKPAGKTGSRAAAKGTGTRKNAARSRKQTPKAAGSRAMLVVLLVVLVLGLLVRGVTMGWA